MPIGAQALNVIERKEPQIRLLVCRTCKSAEELPDWEGRPEDDTLLQITVERHQRPEPHIGILYKFPVKYWAVPKAKAAIMAQIKEGSPGLDVFGTNYYETKSTFQEDALTCWGQHNRTKDCSDYKIDSKQLKPDTAKDRKDAGLGRPGTTGPKVYLCDFCPVKSERQKFAFKEKGLYE